MNARAKTMIAIALMLATPSCSGQPSKTPDKDSTSTTESSASHQPNKQCVIGRTFILTQAEGFQPAEGSTVRLAFTEGKISFNAGCNTHNGTFSKEGDALVVPSGSVASTMMACLPPLDAQDKWLTGFLVGKPTIALDGDTLTLSTNTAKLTFVDRVVADPDRPLVGQKWLIDTIIDGDAASSVTGTPSVQFQTDGRVLVNTGCNTGSGPYEANGSNLKFGMVALTRKACLSEQIAKMESHIVKVISDGSATFRIEASKLTIERDSKTAIKATAER